VPVVQGAAKARRFFDFLAPWYDQINTRIYKREWLERVRSEIRGPRVLDVGVGTGFTTRHLADAVGIDLSMEMLRRARYRGALVRADFMRPPFRGAVFDTVVFAGSFYYMPDPSEAAAIAEHLLRSGGQVVLLSPATLALAGFVRVWSPREYREIFASGFRAVRYERLNWAACLVIAEKR